MVLEDGPPPAEERSPQTADQPRSAPALAPGLAMVGAALLVAGAFCPVLALGSGATRSYRDFAWADGNIILAAAVVAFVLTWVFRWYRGLFVAGGIALLMIGATLLSATRAGGGEVLAWGWLPLTGGALLLLAAAAVAERDRPPERPDETPPDEDEPAP